MTSYKLMYWLLLGVIFFLAGLVAPAENDTSTESPVTGGTTANLTDVSTSDTNTTEIPLTTTQLQNISTTEETNTTQSDSTNGTTPEAATTDSQPTTHELTTESGTTAVPPGPTPCKPGQHFDAASFIGGIVLALGLIAIAFFGWKFYKSRTNHRYSHF